MKTGDEQVTVAVDGVFLGAQRGIGKYVSEKLALAGMVYESMPCAIRLVFFDQRMVCTDNILGSAWKADEVLGIVLKLPLTQFVGIYICVPHQEGEIRER